MKVFFFLLFTISNTYQSCLPSNDLLQSGLHDFVIKSFTNNTTHSFSTQLQYDPKQKHIDFAFSTSSIGGYIPLGFSYSISAEKQQNSNTINVYLSIVNDYRWSFIQVSYLFSSRDDFQLENFQARISQWEFKYNNTYFVQLPTTQRNLPQQNYKAISFISGLETQGKFFSVFIKSTFLKDQKKNLVIEFQPYSDPQFQKISFTYIIYPQKHSIFSLYIQDIQNSIYKFSGPIQFDGNQITYESLSINRNFLNCTGDLCQQSCISKNDCLNQNGFISQSNCILCKNSLGSKEGKCLFQKQCGQNQIWNLQSQNCICSQNSYKYLQVCRKCPQGTKVIKQQNSCVCSFYSQIFLIQQNKCVQCPINSWPNTDKTQCKCFQGYSKINGQCTRCPFNSLLNRKTNKCSCISSNSILDQQEFICKKCPIYSILNQNETECVCRQGYQRINEQCKRIDQCPINFQFKQGICECKQGYYRENQDCIKINGCGIELIWNQQRQRCECRSQRAILIQGLNFCINCSINEIPNQEKNECLCKKGFSRTSSIFCTQIICQQFQVINQNNQCVCKQGYEKNIFNKCQQLEQCEQQTYYNEKSKTCECIDDNSIYIAQSKKCLECPANSSPNQIKIICICNFGYFLKEDKCQSICKDDAQLNLQTNKCECLRQEQIYFDQKCIQCSKNQFWNGTQCVCTQGYNLVDGECIKCSRFSVFNGTHCSCQTGFFPLTNNICFRCHRSCNYCDGPKVNQCTQCKEENADLVDGICQVKIACPQKYYQKNGKCSRCSSQCVLCSEFSNCFRCSQGFKVTQNQLQQTFCRDQCGDGKKYSSECDDGNQLNGDGCDKNCQVQQGWQCSLAGKGQKTICQKVIQDKGKLKIQQNEALQYRNKIFYTFTINNFPQCGLDFKKNQIFKVQVLNSRIIPQIKTNYDSDAPCQLLVQLDYFRVTPASIIQFKVALNHKFDDCWNQNKDESIIVKFSPQALSLFDDATQLTLQQIQIPIKQQQPKKLEIIRQVNNIQLIKNDNRVKLINIQQFEPIPIRSIGNEIPKIDIPFINLRNENIILPEGLQKVLKCRFVKNI